MDQLSDADAASLLLCQSEKVFADMSEEAGADYIGDILEKSLREDGPTVQVVLWREGYT